MKLWLARLKSWQGKGWGIKMCLAYGLLIFNIVFFAAMSALIIIRSRQEARKLQTKNIHVSAQAKDDCHFD
jgi:hypothetical protein